MLEIRSIQAFEDNYIWLLKNRGSAMAAVVDPGDAAPVLELLEHDQLGLGAILITHHHGDHTGGIGGLKAAFPDAVVFGPASEHIDGISHPVDEGAEIILPGIDARFTVLDMPGHTAGHVAYFGEGVLFCGDVLFAAGCGRVFDGTMEEMANSLQRISQLPPGTQLYCAHEYTLANLGFARWVEPQNQEILERHQAVQTLRDTGKACVPSLLSLELKTNPFLRTMVPGVVAAAETWAGQPLADSVAVFKALRTWKDSDYD
ncbi:Hydroxyacylglutathione hydrolase [hydrothermal vent metagenome]|uniref:hydroxyacylglutathione hydrolase n=1 Tax=hydrothermal vent metagenome TaxID=652676 RepID=A0A3B1BIG8_9ZZZZ